MDDFLKFNCSGIGLHQPNQVGQPNQSVTAINIPPPSLPATITFAKNQI